MPFKVRNPSRSSCVCVCVFCLIHPFAHFVIFFCLFLKFPRASFPSLLAAPLLTTSVVVCWGGASAGSVAVGVAVARSHRVAVRAVELTVSTAAAAALLTTITASARAVAIHSVAGVAVAAAVHVGTVGRGARCLSALLADLQLHIQLLAVRVLQVGIEDRLENKFSLNHRRHHLKFQLTVDSCSLRALAGSSNVMKP